MVGKYKKWYQSFGNCLYMHFKLKFKSLGQKLVIWVGGFTAPPPLLNLFTALNTSIFIGLKRGRLTNEIDFFSATYNLRLIDTRQLQFSHGPFKTNSFNNSCGLLKVSMRHENCYVCQLAKTSKQKIQNANQILHITQITFREDYFKTEWGNDYNLWFSVWTGAYSEFKTRENGHHMNSLLKESMKCSP